jgi:cyclin C
MEFFLLNELEFDLVVYHPYTTLLSVCGREPLDDGYWSDDDPDNDDGDVDMEPFSESDDEDDEMSRPGEVDEDTKTLIKRMKRREKKRERRREGETEQDWMTRVWGRGSGRGSWQVDDGVFQMAW